MGKTIYPSEEKKIIEHFFKPTEFPARLSKEVMQSLDGIAAKVIGKEREVFLDKEFGYVWCFGHRGMFENSLLLRIQKGDWSPLSSLASHPGAQNIISDLRTAYNSNPIKFIHYEYPNPFYDPCAIGDIVFAREPKKDIEIYLAVEDGDKMAKSFDDVLNKYNAKI